MKNKETNMDPFDEIQCEELFSAEELEVFESKIKEVEEKVNKLKFVREQQEAELEEALAVLKEYDLSPDDLPGALTFLRNLAQDMEQDLTSKIAEIKDAISSGN